MVMSNRRIASQLAVAGLLFPIACALTILGQVTAGSRAISRAQLELDNGNYSKAIELAQTVVDEAGSNQAIVSSALDTILGAQIAERQYEQAAITLEKYAS